ncbi:hypothetical protein [Paucisalibacillus globulus]|uniref:hypothetical protein n=1 Tax=Paucisalibacillus globulus TaxID=351095 RepID=UPI000BB6C5E4|nr:hypothetical protein [Paucisalibacillus globulus]
MDGGPIVLMGIDAEDYSQGGYHGPISSYATIVSSVLNNVTNDGGGILVIGGGKDRFDDVTRFWNAVSLDINQTVSFANGDGIANISFSQFALLAIASSITSTPSGGLTQEENKLLVSRKKDIAKFVNTGGGLIGFSQTGLTKPYAYLTNIGKFRVNTNLNYDNITSTPAGRSIGIANSNLDIAIWHDEYVTFPSFLHVLAINNSTGKAAAIGGRSVTPSKIL